MVRSVQKACSGFQNFKTCVLSIFDCVLLVRIIEVL